MTLTVKTNTSLAELEQLSLQDLGTSELKALLSGVMSVTAQYITFVARVWHELENRGEDMTRLRTGLTRYLPLVHDGKLDPSVILKFAGHQLLLRELALMPVPEQQRLVGGEKIPLVTQNTEGDFVTNLIDISSLHSRYYSQLFQTGHIRTEEEQKVLLSQPIPRKVRQQKIRKKKVTFDQQKGAFKCGQVNILSGDMLEALASVSGRSKDELAKYLKLSTEQ